MKLTPTQHGQGAGTAAVLTDPAFLQDLRRQMLQFASLQLSDAALAEDAVQEALMGALKNAQSFAGRAALKTWVFSILKNKIADLLRQRQRLVTTSDLLQQDQAQEDHSTFFDHHLRWHTDQQPAAWGSTEVTELTIDNQHFWRIFETCLEHLPAQQGRAFMMREFIELDSNEICAAIGISISNLNVMLYRARLRLRACLEQHWFTRGDTSC